MPSLKQEDLSFPYETFGESPGGWVTIVSAYARPFSDYRAMGRYLAGRGWRALVFDNRGAGKAECPPAFTLDDLADDLPRLWDHLQIPASHLTGVGFGGAIALSAAARHASRVKSLVLVGAPLKRSDLSFEAATPPRDPRRFLAGVARYFSAEFMAANPPVVQGYARQMAKIFQEPDSALGATCQRAAMEGLDLTPLLSSLRAPTLVLHGGEDRLIPVAAASALAGGIAGAKLALFPGSGHLLIAEAPRELYEKIEAFCREIGCPNPS